VNKGRRVLSRKENKSERGEEAKKRKRKRKRRTPGKKTPPSGRKKSGENPGAEKKPEAKRENTENEGSPEERGKGGGEQEVTAQRKNKKEHKRMGYQAPSEK